MVKAYLGLGSNLGNSVETLHQALQLVNGLPHTDVIRTSSIYVTNPIGFVSQPDFYNLVAEIRTSLSPNKLLSNILQAEQQLHRVREVRWGPRTIDIDILLYGQEVVQHPQLHIPHPHIHERGFVLIPLYEITGNIYIPEIEEWLEKLIEILPVEQKVEKVSIPRWQ